MNYNVTQALDQNATGDLLKYFASTDGILEANSGIHDNKCLSIDASDPPCPVQKGMYTKLKLTDESIQITNIDKSSITALVRIVVKPTSQFWTDLNSTPIDWQTEGETYRNGVFKLTKWFIGFKASSHLFDAYRVYSRNRKTSCEQTEALYENAAIRMLKAQEELDYKPGIYTLWENAHKFNDNVCGTYFSLYDLIHATNNTLELEFEVTIPLDDFLPFSAMKMFPNCIFGNLTFEVKMAIQQNLVIAQCDILEVARKTIAGFVENCGMDTEILYASYQLLDNSSTNPYRVEKDSISYQKSFTQVGDTFYCGFFSESAPGVLRKVKNISFTVTDGSLRYCRTNINGFNIKEDIVNTLKSKYSNSSLLIPSQYIDYQAFSQKPLSNGVKCNTTYAMTNVSSLLFLFPRTSNEVTCSRNPLFASLQMQIDNKPYPDKPFSSIEHAHTIYNITNAGLDGLFSPNKEFAYSLTFNELNDQTSSKWRMPVKDNTSYCFLCSTERLSGYGTFCDGISKDNAHITLTGTLLPFSTKHPYLENVLTGEKNERSPIMLVCQDCFWKCTTKGGCEYVCNNKHFVQEETGTQ